MVKRVVLLWHEERCIGICVFAAPASALKQRHRFFGLQPRGKPFYLKQLNEQLWCLARVVIHPTYRGAGLAARFVRTACLMCPVPWIETLSAMGHLHPFFEQAGFRRVGVVQKPKPLSAHRHSRIYGNGRLTEATQQKSRWAEPVYYVLDNRRSSCLEAPPCPSPSTIMPS